MIENGFINQIILHYWAIKHNEDPVNYGSRVPSRKKASGSALSPILDSTWSVLSLQECNLDFFPLMVCFP